MNWHLFGLKMEQASAHSDLFSGFRGNLMIWSVRDVQLGTEQLILGQLYEFALHVAAEQRKFAS